MLLEWDPDKAAANLAKHGVDFHEAGFVLDDALSTTFPDPSHSLDEQRYLTIGSALSGRILWWRIPIGVRRSASSVRGQPP